MNHMTQIIDHVAYHFKIIDAYNAEMETDDLQYMNQAIDAFRFFCGHIYQFYYQGKIIKSFAKPKESSCLYRIFKLVSFTSMKRS